MPVSETSPREPRAQSTGRPILARGMCALVATISVVLLISEGAAQTTSPLTIQPSTGRVNIGLGTNPSATLDVSGGVDATNVLRVSGNTVPFVLVNVGDNAHDYYSISNPEYDTYVMSIGTRGNFGGNPRSLITWGRTVLAAGQNCPTCNVGIGTSNPTYTLHVVGTTHVVGTLSATNKTFRIPHPLEPVTKLLVHGALEGPEHAVYYRGEGQLAEGQAIITLPRYFEALTRQEQRTVQLTTIDGWSPLYVVGKVADGQFTVRTAGGGSPGQRFYWEVKAVRADGDPLVVERPHEPSAERPAPSADAPKIAVGASQ